MSQLLSRENEIVSSSKSNVKIAAIQDGNDLMNTNTSGRRVQRSIATKDEVVCVV